MSLVLEQVSRTVGGVAHISDANLSLAPGSVNVLLGPTLSGKTSLMRLLAGLDVPSAGRIIAKGKDVTGSHVRSRSVAMVYQQFINYPTLSVFENIASPLRVKGIAAQDIEARVAKAARLLRLEPYLKRSPLELSGGQQQRTAIARALVKDAELILLDEPLANLDYKLREELREELPRVFEGTGAILVYATTEPTEALLLGGSTICLHEGRIEQLGPTIEVYEHPRSLYAADVFSDPPLNKLPIEVKGGAVTFAATLTEAPRGKLVGLADGGYTLGFRAHQLALDAKPGGTLHIFPATVLVSELTGSETFVHVECLGVPMVAVVKGVRAANPGTTLSVGINPDRAFVFDRDGHAMAMRPTNMERV